MARMTVGEMLTNIVWTKMTDLKDIKCSGNWMWAAKQSHEGARIYDAAVALRDVMLTLGIAIDGGKDSLSMVARVEETPSEIVKSPGTLVLSGYCCVPDITKKITPDIKMPGKSCLLYVDLSGFEDSPRLGGSAALQVWQSLNTEDEIPDMNNVDLFIRGWKTIQQIVDDGCALAGHDVSDGGLIVTILEMAFAGNCGICADFSSLKIDDESIFAEELGVVIEVPNFLWGLVMTYFTCQSVHCYRIGYTTVEKTITLKFADNSYDLNMPELRDIWEETSFQLEFLQTSRECVLQEMSSLHLRNGPVYKCNFEFEHSDKMMESPKVAIIREEGSNGDRELAAAFYAVGFEVYDITMTDIISGRCSLSTFRGIAFVGGFSYGDVFGSAKGWAGEIIFNEHLLKEFSAFRDRSDTFSLGICNGCQLMSLLGWVGSIRFIQNNSSRFESRFSCVTIPESPMSPAMMFRGMEGSSLGVWIAHGEGKAVVDDFSSICPALHYVDDDGIITEEYPYNPNGSVDGIAGVCSADGRHLALMPHPERSFLLWQWPWIPAEWKKKYEIKGQSPWIKMFRNAYDWCQN
jgi:phosphoribosylformylglycinamidine synthase